MILLPSSPDIHLHASEFISRGAGDSAPCHNNSLSTLVLEHRACVRPSRLNHRVINRLNGNCCEFCWSCLVQVWKSLNQSAVPAVSKGHDFHNWTQKFFAPYDSWPTAKIQLEHNTFHLSIAVFSEYYSPFHRVDGIALASFTILIGKFDNKAKRTFVFFVALCLLRSFATDTCHANAKIDRWRWQHQNISM